MKRAVSAVIVFCLVMLASCERGSIVKSVPPPIPESFSADMLATYGESRLTAQLERKAGSEFKIEVVTPDKLSGLKLSLNGDTGKVSMGSFSFDFDCTKIPETALFKSIINVLKRMTQDASVDIVRSGDNWEYVLSDGEDKKISVLQNGSSGFIETVNIPSCDLSVVFSNFSVPQDSTKF